MSETNCGRAYRTQNKHAVQPNICKPLGHMATWGIEHLRTRYAGGYYIAMLYTDAILRPINNKNTERAHFILTKINCLIKMNSLRKQT